MVRTQAIPLNPAFRLNKIPIVKGAEKSTSLGTDSVQFSGNRLTGKAQENVQVKIIQPLPFLPREIEPQFHLDKKFQDTNIFSRLVLGLKEGFGQWPRTSKEPLVVGDLTSFKVRIPWNICGSPIFKVRIEDVPFIGGNLHWLDPAHTLAPTDDDWRTQFLIIPESPRQPVKVCFLNAIEDTIGQYDLTLKASGSHRHLEK